MFVAAKDWKHLSVYDRAALFNSRRHLQVADPEGPLPGEAAVWVLMWDALERVARGTRWEAWVRPEHCRKLYMGRGHRGARTDARPQPQGHVVSMH